MWLNEEDGYYSVIFGRSFNEMEEKIYLTSKIDKTMKGDLQ
jgi:hypothetical protein